MKKPGWRYLYYYVPPCPQCGSRKTGRYVRTPLTGSGYMKEESLKNGELIRFEAEEPVNNGFCVSCGHEWPVHVETKFWSYARIHEEQLVRGTIPLYERSRGSRPDSLPGSIRRKWKKTKEEDSRDGKEPEEMEPEVFDCRKRDRIELLYLDEELLKKVREVQKT